MAVKIIFITRKIKIYILMISMIILSILACTFDFSSEKNTPDETEISKSVEETLGAEQTVTSLARPSDNSTSLPSFTPGTPEVKATIQAQQATLDAQATMLAQPNIPSPQLVESPTDSQLPPASVEPVKLIDWDSTSLRQAPGCGEDRNGPPCWFGRGDELSMLLKRPILLNPSWTSPYLVFTHRYVFIQTATIYIKGDGSWEVLWSFPSGQSALWKPFEVDLSKYNGQEVVFHFIVSGRSGTSLSASQRNDWKIRDPQIIPDYNPD